MPPHPGTALARRWRTAGRPAKVGWILLAVVAFQAALMALLVAGAAVPDRPIMQQLRHALAAGDLGPNYYPDRMGDRTDGFGECVLVGTGLGEPADNAVERAFTMPRLGNCDGLDDDLAQLLATGTATTEVTSYVRYWAGYTPISRPVLALFGVPGLHLAGAAAFMAAFAAFLLAGRRLVPTAVKLVAFVPLVCSTNLLALPSNSFLHAFATAVMVAGAALVCWAAQRWGVAGIVLAAAVAGALLNYVDLLTAPALGWSLAAFVAGVAAWRSISRAEPLPGMIGRPTDRPARAVLAVSGLAALAWIGGYAITWLSRWLIGTVTLGPSRVWQSVGFAVTNRIDGEQAVVRHAVGAPTAAVLHRWLLAPGAPWLLLLLGIGCVVMLVIVARRRGLRALPMAAVLAAPAALAPLWFETLSNHSQIHTGFAYRSAAMGGGIIVAAVVAVYRAARPGRAATPPRVTSTAT